MGVCIGGTKKIDLEALHAADEGRVNKPLRLLKKELINKLHLEEDHFFCKFV